MKCPLCGHKSIGQCTCPECGAKLDDCRLEFDVHDGEFKEYNSDYNPAPTSGHRSQGAKTFSEALRESLEKANESKPDTSSYYPGKVPAGRQLKKNPGCIVFIIVAAVIIFWTLIAVIGIFSDSSDDYDYDDGNDYYYSEETEYYDSEQKETNRYNYYTDDEATEEVIIIEENRTI